MPYSTTGLILDQASLFSHNLEVGEIARMQRNPPSSSVIQKFEKTSQKLIASLRQTLAFIPLNLSSMYVPHNDPNSLLGSQ
jgi:hypothetical protein